MRAPALAVLGLLAASRAEEAAPPAFEAIVEQVNARNAGWQAEVPRRFGSLGDVERLCGTVLRGNASFREMEWVKTSDGAWPEDVPAEFDVRTRWPKCAGVSGHIRDQSDCGSCWAFGSTEAFNDRRCIATGDTALLSVEDTTANCGFLHCLSMGCNGGQPGMAWKWFASSGVVTGGDYDDIGKGDTCAPYSLAPCAHHVPPSAKYPICPKGEYPTPRVGSACSEKGYALSYKADKKKARSSYGLSSVATIQKDMLQYGSVTGAFTVHADFPTYKSGVYRHTTGAALGGHAIRILGWGTEKGEDYWLVANSWNGDWGDQGTFKIRRGVDECGIEGQVSAGIAAGTAEDVVVI